MKFYKRMINKTLCSLIILTSLYSYSAFGRTLPAFVVADFMNISIVADNMNFNGMTLKSAEFMATGTTQQLTEFYLDRWKDNVKKSVIEDTLILSHYDGHFLYVVQIMNSRQTTTTDTIHGLLSISEPNSLPKKVDLGKGFPKFSSSIVVNDIVSIDLGKRSRTLYFYNQRSIKSNLEYYRRKFSKKGWVELQQYKPPKTPNTAALLMNKGGDELNMAFTSIDGNTNIVAITVEK